MPDLKDKLAAADSEITALRDERKQKVKALDEAKKDFADVDGYDTDSDEFKAADAAVKTVSDVEQRLAEAEEGRTGILRMLSQEQGAPPPTNRPAPAQRAHGWDTGPLFEGDTYRQLAARSTSKSHIGHVELGMAADREATASLVGGGRFVGDFDPRAPQAADFTTVDAAGLVQPDRRGLVQPIYRPLRLLDLIPAGTTDSNLVEYVRMTKQFEEAAETSEGSLKPEGSIAFEDADAPVRTIAEWIKLRKQALADAAGLRSLLDVSLRYDVRRRLEAQVINGNGTGENLQGILETPDILAPTPGSLNRPDRIHKGITAIVLADLEPSVVVIHPTDFESIRLLRDDSGASAGTGGYLYGPPSAVGPTTIWGLPTVQSPAIPQGTALVCDPRGAVVLVREGINVLVSDSDGDDFRRNRVTVLAEMRAGLVVWRPDAFALIDLP